MLSSLSKALFGSNVGATESDIVKQSQRNSFSDYLPYLYYNKDNANYLCMDNSIAYAWECTPLVIASNKQIKQLENIFKSALPKGSVIQFIFYADDHIKPIIDEYKRNKTRNDPLVQKSIHEYANFLMKGTKGIDKMGGIPTRNMRLFVTLKSTHDIEPDLISNIEEGLKGANLFPETLNSDRLLKLLRQLFNNTQNTDEDVKASSTYPLRKQVIDSSIKMDFNDDEQIVSIGKRFARCLTPKELRPDIDSMRTNTLAGGLMGISDDANQICSPFMWTINIVIDSNKSEIHNKASITMGQKSTGSFARAIGKRCEEFAWALDKLEKEPFFKVIPILWVFDDSIEKVSDSSARLKRIWDGNDFQMQVESTLQKSLLIAALPFGLYNVGSNISVIDRHFLFPVSTIARFLPIQGDFFGGSRPVMSMIGRKGQIATLDVFDKRSNNHNFLVSAESGSGKSFKLNRFLSDYYASGSLIRAVDLGYSYQKTCKIYGGRFIDVGKENVVINPFSSQATDKEDIEKDLMAAATVLGEMAYSASGAPLHETEWSLLKSACFWAYREGRTVNGIDAVQEYLGDFPNKEEIHNVRDLTFAKNKAAALAFNLKDFTSTGVYGRFFNGSSTFDISQDEFVVLELEQLKGQKELFGVMVMQVMNAVTQDLYLSTRDKQRFILFEEAASLLKKQGQSDLSRLGAMIEEGYRRARKYEGSFGVVLQDVMDTKSFGSVGDVILTNAAFKFYLEGKSYEKAALEKVIPHSGIALELLDSVKNNRPKYSEMFVDSGIYKGVARLCVDPWSYWLATSDGKEVNMFNSLLAQGKTPLEAISTLSGIRI